ncbi:MAG: transposase [Anaerolineaceae bacterium]|nr:transposase [Anaerolineaceae bacterium]
MMYDPAAHHRRSIRLPEYDYSQPGAYFITLVTYGRECLFGEIRGGEIILNEYGQIAHNTWDDLIHHITGIELDVFVVMPNHVHGIIHIVGAGSEPAPTIGREPAPTIGREPALTIGREPAPTIGREPTPTIGRERAPTIRSEPAPTLPKQTPLSEIVRQLKTFSARRINEQRGTHGIPVWQRNYYEHIIRDDAEHQSICDYIANNPAQWLQDHENPPRG